MKVKRSRPACRLVMLAVSSAMLADGGGLQKPERSVTSSPSARRLGVKRAGVQR